MTKIIMLKDLLVEQPPKPPAQGGDDEQKPQKLKIDIPNSPFEPDVSQITDRLKQILKQWETKKYPSDEYRWKSYYKDVLKLVQQIEKNKESQ